MKAMATVSQESLTYVDREGYRNTLEEMLNGLPADIALTIISSKDGLLVQAEGSSRQDSDQLAAISASVLSLADAIVAHSDGVCCEKVFSQSEDHDVLIMHAGKFIITLIGKRDANMGLLLAAGKRLSASIAELTKAG